MAKVCLFDVNETLLDSLFERVFGFPYLPSGRWPT